MIHQELSGKIIGAAMEVLNELKPGLDEKLYERAMIIELKHRGHSVSVQRSFPVSYRGERRVNEYSSESYPCYPCNPWFLIFFFVSIRVHSWLMVNHDQDS